jgi:hypothetical protein
MTDIIMQLLFKKTHDSGGAVIKAETIARTFSRGTP